MKVKAIEVNAKCSYITKGNVYEVQKPTANKFCYIHSLLNYIFIIL